MQKPFGPRKKPLQARALATMEALLEATAQLLMEHGYAGASTNKIARRAGVSIGSLYQYFSNKESIVAALIERAVDAEFSLVEEHLAQIEDAPLEEVIHELLASLITARTQNPELTSVLYEHVPPLGAVHLVRVWTRKFQELILTALENKRDELRPENLELASFLIVNAVHGITEITILDRPELLQDPELARETAELVIRYLKK